MIGANNVVLDGKIVVLHEGETICAPYSVRPRQSAPVSTPLQWKELEKSIKTLEI